jgi:hypothetical protein
VSGFDDHGVRSLSASQINTYIASPAYWVLQKLFGARSEPNAAMVRGISAESGVVHGLFHQDASLDDCIAVALREFDEKLSMSNDPKFDLERNGIPGLIEHALAELKPYGVPSNAQERIEVKLPDVPVPFIGFTDVEYADHGIIVDLKTTLRMPSAISEYHARQGAIYAFAKSNYAMRFAYVKPKPSKGDTRACNVYEMTPDDVRMRLAEVVNVATRMERFLSLSKDKNELAALLVPDFTGFQWSNENTREQGRKLFGW